MSPARLAGAALILAAATNWAAWLLMPDAGTADPAVLAGLQARPAPSGLAITAARRRRWLGGRVPRSPAGGRPTARVVRRDRDGPERLGRARELYRRSLKAYRWPAVRT